MFWQLLVFAGGPQPWSEGPNQCVEQGVATLKGFECLLQNVLLVALPLLGLAVGAMVVVAGFQLITAGGEREQIKKAKNTATYAVVGLVLASLSWLILRFIEYLTGFKLTEFKIGP